MIAAFIESVSLFHLPLIATGIFVAMFLVVLLRVAQRARRAEYDRMASLPLDDYAIFVGADAKENTHVR